MFLDHSHGMEPMWGVSFSPAQAENLGLDWRETYIAALDDLHVSAIRLSAYWNRIEKKRGVYDFTELDWQVEEAARRDVKILLAVGRRLPRWPECHEPLWYRGAPMRETAEDVHTLVEAVVNRYKDRGAIAMWQVENEAFLSVFGECPSPDPVVLQEEIDLVRSLDDRPILITDSGELSWWRHAAPLGDYFGTTMYRVVWNPLTKYWSYDYVLPPVFYRMKAWLVGKSLDRVIGAELQAEPWAPRGLLALSDKEREQSLSVERFRGNVDFARRTGIQEHYLWGVEYWYWLKKQGDDRLWEEARALWFPQ